MSGDPRCAVDVAQAALDVLRALSDTVPGAWADSLGGAEAVVSGVPVATLNGVWAVDEEVSADTLCAGLARVAAAGMPFCLQARPACAAAAERAADELALVRTPAPIPLMSLHGAPPSAGATPSELSIRRLQPAEAGRHGALAARAFDAPAELFDRVVEPALTLAGARAYLGTVADEPVCTGVAVTRGDAVSVFNIATPPEYRRRGYASALTARAVADGLASGATWSWLQSSASGLGVYARLGFVELERWDCWLSA